MAGTVDAPGKDHFVRVTFTRFKAFSEFTLSLRQMNILAGRNNAGKSTILAAFRILAVAMQKARHRKPETVEGPRGPAPGYRVDIGSISVAEENIFFNYDSAKPASVSFKLSNGNELLLFFGSSGSCVLIARAEKPIVSPTVFCKNFNCDIGFVPILGPVEHNERLFEEETARKALFNYTASRHFRNIWHHYPEAFETFRALVKATWPGMDVTKPIIEHVDGKPRLFMFCPEERIPRELCWAGFGFQVWCQMLTHLILSKEKSIFLIDEPDIYLHSDLQRQLLSILRDLGPDILIATHSTEIISESESDDIVLIDKRKKTSQRINDPSRLIDVFASLGSNLNPTLTQLAKTRKAVFVEGKDFQILGRFAQRIGLADVSNRSRFAVVPIEGFNPQRMKILKEGMEMTLGCQVQAIVVLDRDYRCEEELRQIESDCRPHCSEVIIHRSKEIENFLLVPAAIDRAARKRVHDRAKRSGNEVQYADCASSLIEEFANQKQAYVQAQTLYSKKRYVKTVDPNAHEAKITESAINQFIQDWNDPLRRKGQLPGKEALSFINQKLQERFSVSVTAMGIIDAMRQDELPAEIVSLLSSIDRFSKDAVTDNP